MGFGVGGRSSGLGTNPFLHGRVGGRNGNDGQEKTNDKKVTTEAFCLWIIIMEKNTFLLLSTENSYYQHWCEGLTDSKSPLKSMSSGVLGGKNKDLQQ